MKEFNYDIMIVGICIQTVPVNLFKNIRFLVGKIKLCTYYWIIIIKTIIVNVIVWNVLLWLLIKII